MKQVFLLTYMDAFRIIGVFLLCCMPLLIVFKRHEGSAVVAAAVH